MTTTRADSTFGTEGPRKFADRYLYNIYIQYILYNIYNIGITDGLLMFIAGLETDP